MQSTWLEAFAGQSLGDFEVSHELDRDLSRRALLARDDPAERDELFRLLAAKVARFARRFRSWPLDPWEYDDVVQETYPAYLATLKDWKPREMDGQPAGFLFYFLRVYPLRLSYAVTRLARRWRPLPLPEDWEETDDTASCENEAITLVLVDDLSRLLSTEEAKILRLRVVSDRIVPEAAAEIGMARRTAYRRWHRIVEIGREYLREAG